MKINTNTVLWLLMPLSIMIHSCHSHTSVSADTMKAKSSVEKPVYADSIFGDNKIVSIGAFILPDSADMYTLDSLGFLIKYTTLHMNDSLLVYNVSEKPFQNAFYRIVWRGHQGYIWGTALCSKIYTDFDGDGRKDQILCGYTDYDTSFMADAQGLHPMLLRMLSATGQHFDIYDSGYSQISLSELTDRDNRFATDITDTSAQHFSRPTTIYYTDAGYPACGYGQFRLLIACRNGRPQVIHRHTTFNDSGQGNYYDVILPTIANHSTDTILLIQKLSMPYSQGDSVHWDSLIVTVRDSSILYPVGDKWKTETFYKAPERK